LSFAADPANLTEGMTLMPPAHARQDRSATPRPARPAVREIPVAPAGPHRRVDLEQLQRLLPTLIDALSDAVVVVDRQRRVVAVNRRYAEVFGVGSTDVLAVTCHETLHCSEGAIESHRCMACEAIDAKQPRRLLRSRPDTEGRPRRWEVSFNPALDAKGDVTHVVEVWRDISERSQLESQLAHSERLASLGLLAAGVAHEINNPLASLLAGVESLERWLGRAEFDPKGVAEAAEVLELLEEEARRCRETTDKLMLLAQPVRTAPTPMNMNDAVRDTLSLLNFEMRTRHVVPVESLDPALPEIWARASGMRGVCMNLMINAVQAMPAGGTLRVSTRPEGEGILLEIEDTGSGIDPVHLDRIWDPFFTTKPVGQGTGLGLSITQRVVTRHGGRIQVESRAGEGARFIVWLPVAGPGGDGA
jgi:PAS domain S-box-containing protein